MALFIYNGGPITDPLSYSQTFIPPTCTPGPTPCTVEAELQLINGVPRPIITSPLSNEITIAASTSTPSANVKVRQ